MQFGIFAVGDVTTDPATGRTPTEHERVKATVAIARKAEEIGLDVFATGEHHNPPFVPSSPTTMLRYIAGQTEKLILSTATPPQGFTSTPQPLDGVPPFVWHGSIRSPEIAEQAAYYGDGFFANHIFWPTEHFVRLVNFYRQRFAHYGHGTPGAGLVGLGGQVYMRKNSQDAVREFRPYFDNAPVYGHGPSLEEFAGQTPLTVGSPQEVIDNAKAF